MKDKPILMSAPMVRATLDGSKTQTRRIAKPSHGKRWLANSDNLIADCAVAGIDLICPFGKPGDLLWVRETSLPDFPKEFSYYDNTWQEVPAKYRKPKHCIYKATWDGFELIWKPSIHMPRWASRLTLEITDVRIERLNDISEKDAVAEGIEPFENGWINYIHEQRGYAGTGYETNPIDSYASLWESINGSGSWDKNPWVWVISFKVHKQNIDDFKRERGIQ